MYKSPFIKHLTITGIVKEATDFKVFLFAKDEAARIPYKAGQYLTLLHDIHGVEIRRSYSLISSPYLNESLSIGVKRVPNGIFSRYLFDALHVGDKLVTTGAAGLFILPDNIHAYKQIFFYAAGSGISPIYSLLKSALYLYAHLHIVLVYSNHSLKDAAFLQPLQTLQQQFTSGLHVEFLYSEDKNIFRAHLHRDLLINIIKQYSNASLHETLAFVCGPDSYMRMCTYNLQQIGMPADNIRKEIFSTAKPAVLNQPPDTATYHATIHFRGETHTIEVVYPDTILKAAKRKGIELAYSCEAGKCGNCTMRCTKGDVWMQYNEVLTDRDVQNGLVLTCVGHPVFGDVELYE